MISRLIRPIPYCLREPHRVDATLVRQVRSGDLFLDAMTRLGEAARYETVEAEIKQVDGIRVRVATPAALFHLKRGTVRPLDRQDAAAIAKRFHLKEGD